VTGVTPSGSTFDNDWLVAGLEFLMSTVLIIWLVIAAIAFTGYLVSNIKPKPEPEEIKKHWYPAVSVDIDESDACPAVMKIVGKRILSSAAPALPLVDCTAEVCTCTYRNGDDRRAEDKLADIVEQEKEHIAGADQGTLLDLRERMRRHKST
jgi:hypothetical protein